MGTFKTRAQTAHHKAQLPSEQPEAMLNRAGGVAFDIPDPALKLVTMTGSAFFAEPKYYDGVAVTAAIEGKKRVKLDARLQIAREKAIAFAPGAAELDSVAQEIIMAAAAIPATDHPEDLLAIAAWLRLEMNIRLTPAILLAIASRFKGCQPKIREYAKHVLIRADDIKNVLLAHRFLFGSQNISNGLVYGLGDALSKFGEAALMKYDGTDFPTWKDVMCWLPRRRGWPVKHEIAKYFIQGEVVNPEATPIIAARKALAAKEVFDNEAQQLARRSKVNWEVLVSQFGKDPKQKAKVWEFLVNEGLLGYMARLRNLRNLVDAGVELSVLKEAGAKISDREAVLRSKQLPFRFLSAASALHVGRSPIGHRVLMDAIEAAMDIACDNVQALPGVTAIFADNSGSMSAPISQKSKVRCSDAANILCGIVAKRAEMPVVCAFGTSVAGVSLNSRMSALAVAEAVRTANTKGCSTNAYLIPRWLAQHKINPDRVIIISDMQCWNSNSYGDATGASLADEWEKFCRGGSDRPWLHSIHINGYGDTPVQSGMPKVNLTAGFSEKVFNQLLAAEGKTGDGAETKAVPTVEQIRSAWGPAHIADTLEQRRKFAAARKDEERADQPAEG